MPRLTAAPLPWFCGWRNKRTRASVLKLCRISYEPSVEQSSTNTCSTGTPKSRCSNFSHQPSRCCASLKTGMISESVGAGASVIARLRLVRGPAFVNAGRLHRAVLLRQIFDQINLGNHVDQHRAIADDGHARID